MHREILFRGKRIDNGEWVYGFYVREEGLKRDGFHSISHIIITKREPFRSYQDRVYADTVGQYTGMIDKGKNKIFEGDLYRSDSGYIFEVVYLESEACFVGVPVKEPESWVFLEDIADMERVGNKWDNSELLEVLDDEA